MTIFDKTWQEACDALLAGKRVIVVSGSEYGARQALYITADYEELSVYDVNGYEILRSTAPNEPLTYTVCPLSGAGQ